MILLNEMNEETRFVKNQVSIVLKVPVGLLLVSSLEINVSHSIIGSKRLQDTINVVVQTAATVGANIGIYFNCGLTCCA